MSRPATCPRICLASLSRNRSSRRVPSTIRRITIISTNTSTEPQLNQEQLDIPSTTAPATSPDAQFEVLGTPFSLLHVSLSASQTLFTRRGTLVGLSGKPESVLSTLSTLSPLRRLPVGIPFLYQKIAATTPVTALISTKSTASSIVTVHLDGREDWVAAQRQGLLAWTGQTLSLKPQYNTQLGVAQWGNTYITGRGLVALVGTGQIYQVQVRAGESYVAHPSNVVAYAVSGNAPQPYRFKSSRFRLQIPDLGLGSLVQNVKFFRVMSTTTTWRTISGAYHTIRTWLRRSIFGDRLFLRFEGPTTMLLQSRASRVSDVLTLRDVDEIADSPPGAVQDAVERKIKEEIREIKDKTAPIVSTNASGTVVRYATVRAGKAEFDKNS